MHIQHMIEADPGQAMLLLGTGILAVAVFVVLLRRALRSKPHPDQRADHKGALRAPKRRKASRRKH